MIIDHTHPGYVRMWKFARENQFNGAYYYSREIVRNIIPRVETDRSWITINVRGSGCDHAIVFIHNNLHPQHYDWLWQNKFKDLVLVCGVPETMDKVRHIGTPIHIPLSVDVDEVSRFKTDKTRATAFVGRNVKRRGIELPKGIDYIEGLPREQLLSLMARYESVYAVGRTAIEARVLGCNVLPYDPRYPDPSIWQILDNKDAAVLIQQALDEIDGVDHG